MAEVSAGSLYEVNKSLVENNEKQLKGKKLFNRINSEVGSYLKEKLSPTSKRFMLLCHERRDYTVFNFTHYWNLEYSLDISKAIEECVKVLHQCFKNRGNVYGIDKTSDGVAIEIWIKSSADGEMNCYYLFPCDEMVVDI